MYDPASNNKRQLETLIEKIQSRRHQLEVQKHELERMIVDLETWEERTSTAMENKQKSKKVN
jgi:uncharacterized protein YlxW (UPF0749 family)